MSHTNILPTIFVNSGSTPVISLSEVTVCIVLDLIEHRKETTQNIASSYLVRIPL